MTMSGSTRNTEAESGKTKVERKGPRERPARARIRSTGSGKLGNQALSEPIEVAAAVIRDGDRVLLSHRAAYKHQGDRWEFPGGKCEPGESVEQSLARELDEELGLAIHACRPFMTLEYVYPERCVHLFFREVTDWVGEPRGREGQPVDWVPVARLADYPLPEANQPLIAALNLPDAWAIRPPEIDDGAVERALPARAAAGQGVYLRGLETQPERLAALTRACREQAVPVMVRDDADLARELGADVLHLSTRTAARQIARPDFPGYLSVACHSAVELNQARQLGAEQVLLSPVAVTPSHPGMPGLGWSAFRKLATGRPLAVYALGGVGPDDLNRARVAGARGVAGIRGFWEEQARSTKHQARETRNIR